LIKDVSANLETSIGIDDIVIPEGIEKKINQPTKKLTRILGGIAAGAILATAGWFGWTSLNKQDSEIPVQTETETPIPQDSPAVQEPGTTATTSTTIPDWVEEFSTPILSAIKDQPPDFEDDFSQVDPHWLYRTSLLHSEETCPIPNGAYMDISGGSLKIGVEPNCP
jgi:hypothetical protein